MMKKILISDSDGFSLIELLIAAFISVLILSVLFLFLNSILKQTAFQNEEFKSSLLYLKETVMVQLNSSASSFNGGENKFSFKAYLKDGKNIFHTECVYEILSQNNGDFLKFRKKKYGIDLDFKEAFIILRADNIRFDYEYFNNELKEFKILITEKGRGHEIKIPVL